MDNIYIDYYDYLLLKIHGIIKDKIDYDEDWNHNKTINCVIHEISIENAYNYIYMNGMPYTNINLKRSLKELVFLKFEDLILIESSNRYYMLNYYKKLYQYILNFHYEEDYSKSIISKLYSK